MIDADRLPKTADGVDATTCETYWSLDWDSGGYAPCKHAVVALIWSDGKWWFAKDDVTGWDFHNGVEELSKCYSTREAAEAAEAMTNG